MRFLVVPCLGAALVSYAVLLRPYAHHQACQTTNCFFKVLLRTPAPSAARLRRTSTPNMPLGCGSASFLEMHRAIFHSADPTAVRPVFGWFCPFGAWRVFYWYAAALAVLPLGMQTVGKQLAYTVELQFNPQQVLLAVGKAVRPAAAPILLAKPMWRPQLLLPFAAVGGRRKVHGKRCKLNNGRL